MKLLIYLLVFRFCCDYCEIIWVACNSLVLDWNVWFGLVDCVRLAAGILNVECYWQYVYRRLSLNDWMIDLRWLLGVNLPRTASVLTEGQVYFGDIWNVMCLLSFPLVYLAVSDMLKVNTPKR